jgi:hypothetical protein
MSEALASTQAFMKRHLATLLAAIGCSFWCGCDYSITGRLWQERDYVVPAPNPHLALFQTAHGILVQYDASYERDGGFRRQAYYLEPNLKNTAARQKPILVDSAKAGPKTAILIFTSLAVNAVPPPLYAICSTNQSTFTLYRQAESLGPCELPVYKDRRETATQAALTPLAVTGDASIVGAVAGYLWVESRGGSVTVPGPWPKDH